MEINWELPSIVLQQGTDFHRKQDLKPSCNKNYSTKNTPKNH